MDTNDTDPIIDTKVPNQASEVKSGDQQKYQQVLDEYSQELDKNPAKPSLDTPIPPLPPSPPTSTTPPPPQPSQPPETPQAQPPEPAPLPDQPQPPKKKFNLFKYLFYISALVFLVLVGLLVKDYLTLQQINLSEQASPSSPTPTATIPTTISDSLTSTPSATTDVPQICSSNGQSYQVGDTIPAQNVNVTCICQITNTEPHVICTQTKD